jgi:hypothetical protein
MTTLTEGMYPAEFIVAELPNLQSRLAGVLLSGNDLDSGSVLGKLTKDTVAIAAADGNTGDASLAAVTVTLGAAALPGVYTLTCTAASTNAGTFSVKAPSGVYLPDLTVASAYAGDHINLTLPDGTTDWDVGDVVTVTVAGSGKWTQLTPAAVNGSQHAAGFLYAPKDASGGDVDCVVLYWAADVNAAEITWPDAITDGQKATALAELSELKLRVQ